METSRFDQIFRDDQGNIVIAQPPNLSLATWMGASLLKLVVSEGPAHIGLDIVASIALVIWAMQEIFDGVNYFRRGLGLVVLIIFLLTRLT